MLAAARWYWEHQRHGFSGFWRWVMDWSSFVAVPGTIVGLFWDVGNDAANWLIGTISIGFLFATFIAGPLWSAYRASLAKDATIAKKEAEITILTDKLLLAQKEKLNTLNHFIQRLEACKEWLGHVPGTPHFSQGRQELVSVELEIKEFLKLVFPSKMTFYLRTHLRVPGDNSLISSFCADRLYDLKQILSEVSRLA